MFDRLERALRLLAYTAVLGLCGAQAWSWFASHLTRTGAGPELGAELIGRRITLDESVADSDPVLVFALSTVCPFCSASAPFYQQLIQTTSQSENRIKSIAFFPQEKVEAARYASEILGTSFDAIIEGPPDRGINRTPTLLLVDSSGEIRDAWIGLLSPAEQSRVVERVLALATPGPGQ